VSDHVFTPIRSNRRNYSAVYIFVYRTGNVKTFCAEWQQAFPDFNLLLFSSWIEFLCIRGFHKYFNFSTL
jgi:hypothetical protein